MSDHPSDFAHDDFGMRPAPAKRMIAIALVIVVIASTILMAWRYFVYTERNQVSEDAIIQANIVHIAAMVPGKLETLAVKDGQRVSKGELLFKIDPATYELRVRQARAELALTKAGLNDQLRRIEAESANAVIADEQVQRAQANLELAQSTLKRLESLAPKGYVTAQQVDAARTAQRDAEVSLTQASSQAKAAQALIGQTEAAQATVEVATAALAIAEKALADTVVHAPGNGLVVGLNVSQGEMLAPEQSLFTLIDTDAWYATALFRETELPSIKVGDCAAVYTMAAPGTPMKGRVESIGWGVTTEDMLSLPRTLPFVQKSLNWVRVAQRFPVRILITDPVTDLMRVGASASVVIRDEHTCEGS
ncbi:multidrug transporter subunit MdtN [Orrella marina]|nr:multidrug transporter subunit MdtN [Orrella marina]